ncbi:MAG TPA: hypothetical protein VHP83_26625 [Aggregatilineaceae bacterium]|nr:hypothetical protein [Aggregatilineaceae bacterium]
MHRLRRPTAYDFSQMSAYFVTVAVNRSEPVLGDVVNNNVWLTDTGQAVTQTWDSLPAALPGIIPDSFVIMPNHIHGVVFVPRQENPLPALEAVLRAFKSLSTLACNGQLGRTGGRFWQHGFEYHLLHDEADLKRARQYITEDPARWDEDDYNPARVVQVI